jgi:hypothetical protein
MKILQSGGKYPAAVAQLTKFVPNMNQLQDKSLYMCTK